MCRRRTIRISGSDSRNRDPFSFLPGIAQRDVRQGQEVRKRSETLLATQSYGVSKFFLLGNGELPRKLRLEHGISARVRGLRDETVVQP